jgi:hypothetical protein
MASMEEGASLQESNNGGILWRAPVGSTLWSLVTKQMFCTCSASEAPCATPDVLREKSDLLDDRVVANLHLPPML